MKNLSFLDFYKNLPSSIKQVLPSVLSAVLQNVTFSSRRNGQANTAILVSLGILASSYLSTCAQVPSGARSVQLAQPSAAKEAVPANRKTTGANSGTDASQTVALTSIRPVTFTSAQYKAAIVFDYEGENGKLQSNPSAQSLGYPCGVPNSYGWKYATKGVSDISSSIGGRGQQQAGAAYNQVYNACGTRKTIPNARVEFTDMVVYYYSKSQNKWIQVTKKPAGGAAFAEDFVKNQATQADIRNEPQGHKSVRSGIGNAGAAAGSLTGRTVQDGKVGFNFHGFPDRFSLNWSDAKAIIVAQAMRCIPNAGSDLGDCKKLGYIANVGLDSWASPSSAFDNFKTHGGVSGGRFKPVTTDWQIFTNYIGPKNLAGLPVPPLPQF
jgi:hypothetical protein